MNKKDFKMRREDFDQFRKGYLAAAVFADLEEEYIGKKTADDITTMSIYHATLDCRAFLAMAEELITSDNHVPGSVDDTPFAHAGRDFWYTRQCHGCGYFDGDWPINGDKLTKIAKTFGEKYLWVDSNGWINIE